MVARSSEFLCLGFRRSRIACVEGRNLCVGDLAIIFGARVVYLAGGVTGHIPQFLHDGRFLQRYLNKGVMTEQLERVPVWRVEHGQLGLLGAVAWYRQNRAGI